MIEIKFRAWDKRSRKMRAVTQLTFGLPATGHPLILMHLDDGTDDPVTRSPEEAILLQNTGFGDKNGKEIYESDILNFTDNNIGIVEWSTSRGMWIKRMSWSSPILALNPEASILELGDLPRGIIIGNIYENPELLK